jgi:hypothetical protein
MLRAASKMTDESEKAQAYNNAVSGVGYAGILAVFSLTHDLLPVWARAIVALCLIWSLALYVGWVVATMYVGVLRAQGRGDTLVRRMAGAWHLVLS